MFIPLPYTVIEARITGMGNKHFAWALFLLWITGVPGKQILTVPSVMEAGSTTPLCIMLQGIVIDAGLLDVHDRSIVTANISTKFIQINRADQSSFASQSLDEKHVLEINNRGYHDCFTIATPASPGEFTFVVNLDVTCQTPGGQHAARSLLAYNSTIRNRVTPLVTLIQTDKPMYRPGQTVKFTVVTMDHKFNQKTDGYSLITIDTPNEVRIKQWEDVDASTGIVSLEMSLSNDTVLGDWKIKVIHGTAETEQVFTVEDNVLPRFDVTVTPPITERPLPTNRKTCISSTVCARYTYGKPVKGELSVNVCFKPNNSNQSLKENRPCGTITTKIDGCHEFCLNVDDLKLREANNSRDGYLTIIANVTEEQTGITMSGTSSGLPVTASQISIKITDSSNNKFKPGFPYKAKVIVLNLDGTPVHGEKILIAATPRGPDTLSWYVWNNTFTTNEDGIVYFSINDLEKGMKELLVRVTTHHYSFGIRHSPEDKNAYQRAAQPSALHRIFEWHSPSDSFIYMLDIDRAIECDVTLPVNVYYTVDEPMNDYPFLSIIRAGENVVKSTKSYINSSDIAFISSMPSNDRYESLIRTHHAGKDFRFPRATETLDEKAEPIHKRLAHFKLDVPITTDYSPYAKLLLMYTRNDGEVVAASLQLNVKGCFRNKATLAVAKIIVRPGEPMIDFMVSASPGSTCFVSMVDKHVVLQAGNNQQTPEGVLEKVGVVTRRYVDDSFHKQDLDFCLPKPHGSVNGGNSMTAFRDIGIDLAVFADGQIPSRPCFNEGINETSAENTHLPDKRAATKRNIFPEPWLWDVFTLRNNESGRTLHVTVPDTITEWVGNTICTHPNDGIGVSDTIQVSAFQPFAVSLTLPSSAVLGEALPVTVNVFNYLSECIPMELRFREEVGFKLRDRGNQKRHFCFCGGDYKSFDIFIISTVVGEIDIAASVESVDTHGLCTDVLISKLPAGVVHGVRQRLLIEAEGIPQELTWSSYICANELQITGANVVIENDSLVVRCSSRRPKMDFEWFFNGIMISASGNDRVTVTEGKERSVIYSELRISRSRREDSGEYICRSSNLKIKTIKVNVIRDKVKRSASVSDEVEVAFWPHPTHITVQQGGTAVLTCGINNHYLRDKTTSRYKYQPNNSTSEYIICPSSWLCLSYVDVNFTSSNQVATFTNPEVQRIFAVVFNQTDVKHLHRALSYQYSVNYLYVQIVWSKEGSTFPLTIGSLVYIPDRRINIELRDSSAYVTTRLTIFDAKTTDEGRYICQVANKHKHQFFVTLQVNEIGVKNNIPKWTLPKYIVPNTYRATVSVVGDIIGPNLSNPKYLLGLPYSDSEQSIASWASSVYVLQYLSASKKLSPETETEATNRLFKDYQRQAKYRYVDHSYSRWGDEDNSQVNGSLWLTALAVKLMAQSSDFVSIDTKSIFNSALWIVSKQNASGCFQAYGNVSTWHMRGGLSNDEEIAASTAFIPTALLEANIGFEHYIAMGFECLDTYDVLSTDTYTLSIMLYAHTLRNVAHSRRSAIMLEVQKRKVSSNGMTHWKLEELKDDLEDNNAWYTKRALSVEVEMTAYILLSILEEGLSSVNADTLSIVQWLTTQRNAYGGFLSSQDTVVALQALAKFGQLTYMDDNAVTVQIKNSDNQNVFELTTENSLLTQTYELAGDETGIEVTTTGSGCVLAQVNINYNVYSEEDSAPAFAVNVNVHRSSTGTSNCARRSLSVCARYLKSESTNMAVVDVKMPTGWIPIENSLRQLANDMNNEIQNVDVANNHVLLYFEKLFTKDTCVAFEVAQTIRMSPKQALVKVYDYYEPGRSVTTNYKIKTTCETKEEIPLNNQGKDCDIEQCRVVDTFPIDKTCPICLSGNMTIDEFIQVTCESEAVYKVVLGREGAYSMKINADFRTRWKVSYPNLFVYYEMAEHCSCPMLRRERRVFIFTKNRSSVLSDTKTCSLTRDETIIPYNRSTMGLISRIVYRLRLCLDYKKLRLKGTKRSKTKLLLLKRKYNVVD